MSADRDRDRDRGSWRAMSADRDRDRAVVHALKHLAVSVSKTTENKQKRR